MSLQSSLHEKQEMMILYLLLFCQCVLFSDHVTAAVVEESCSEGFMDYSLLTVKAGQIPDTAGSLSDGTLAEKVETRWIIDKHEFDPPGNDGSCNLIEVILAVDIRPVIGDRNQYPSIEVWKPLSGSGDRFQNVGSVPVTLSPVNFTTSGVYRFTFPTPISVSDHYRLGVRQPPNDRSIVRLFTRADDKADVFKIRMANINEMDIRTTGGSREIDTVNFDIVIYPVTETSNCFGNNDFLPESTVVSASSSITNISAVTNQTVFPDIRITCDGIITNWIVGTAATRSSNFPLVQLRRSTMLYTALTLNTDNGTLVSANLYNFSVSVEVKAGDILVITSTADPVYYQQFNGPLNYQIDSDNSFTPLDSNDYPLISVVIESTSPAMEMSSSTVGIAVISSTFITTAASMSLNPTVTSLTSVPTNEAISSTLHPILTTSTASIPISQTVIVSPTTPTTDEGRATNIIPAIVGAIIGSLLVLVLVIVTVLAVALICRRFRKTGQLKLPVNHDVDLKNPLYSNTSSTFNNEAQVATLRAVSNVVYGAPENVQTAQMNAINSLNNPVYSANEAAPSLNAEYEEGTGILYEEPVSSVAAAAPDGNVSKHLNGAASELYCYAESGLPSSKAAAADTDNGQHGNVYSVLQRELCVPTAEERSQTSGHYETDETVYSTLFNTQNVTKQKTEFFPEDPIYWEPGSDTVNIYQQLSDRKYREIVRQQIQITGHLGLGQFGTVNQGIWYSPHGPVDAAIKTLNDNTSEVEKVKFLQEAAIMGQFHHPNVVKLLGVVTVGEPTMIVLELISGGDLRGYLQKYQPSPGELVQSTLPALLLNFCHQIASGMKYLSKKCFVHRDLAARNILVTEHSICKIADFGMSRDLQDENYYISHAKKIPIKWTAPEALHFKRYSTASDVWSYGAVLYEIWSLGHKPFESYSNQECMRLIESGYRLPPPPGCPRAVYELMIQCWHPETSGRPTFAVLVNSLSPTDSLLAAMNANGSQLGMTLETGRNLYTDLQNTYTR